LKPCEESVSVWWNRFLSTGASKYVVWKNGMDM
jgi:hypothetical protein